MVPCQATYSSHCTGQVCQVTAINSPQPVNPIALQKGMNHWFKRVEVDFWFYIHQLPVYHKQFPCPLSNYTY